MQLKTFRFFWAAMGCQEGKKMLSEGIKDKLTPTLTSFWSVEGGKMMQESGGGDNFFIAPKHHFYPLDSLKRCRNERLINLLLPHSFIVLLPWQPVAAQKDVRVLSRILFKKRPTIPAPLLNHYAPWQPHYYTILPALNKLPPDSYIILPPW